MLFVNPLKEIFIWNLVPVDYLELLDPPMLKCILMLVFVVPDLCLVGRFWQLLEGYLKSCYFLSKTETIH